MKTVYPIFWISELTCDYCISDPSYYQSQCVVYVDLMNSRGEVCKRAALYSIAKSDSQEESVLKCVENLLNGNYKYKTFTTAAIQDVVFDLSKTQFYFEGISEPWYSFFQKLIQEHNWKIQSALML